MPTAGLRGQHFWNSSRTTSTRQWSITSAKCVIAGTLLDPGEDGRAQMVALESVLSAAS